MDMHRSPVQPPLAYFTFSKANSLELTPAARVFLRLH